MRNVFSDIQIVNGFKTKDNLVIKHVYFSYKKAVENYVTRNSGTLHDSEDVLHEAIMSILKTFSSDNFILLKTFDAYFTTTYQNTWKCKAKFKRREELTESFTENIIEDNSYLYDEYKLEQIKRLTWNKYRKLPEECQKVLEMFFYQKKSMSEIAFKMDYKNQDSAKSKKYKCIEKLKEIITNHPTYKNLSHE